MAWFILALLTLLPTVVSGQGRTPYDWRLAPYHDKEFVVNVHYTRDTVLYCNDSRVAEVDGLNITKWITPELEIIRPGNSSEFHTLDGPAGWHASQDGFMLHINNTHDRHFGLYYCELQNDAGGQWLVKRAVNLDGAFWGSVWWKYERAATWSFIGSLVVGLMFAAGAFVYNWLDDQNESAEIECPEDDFEAILAKLGYDNNEVLGSGNSKSTSTQTMDLCDLRKSSRTSRSSQGYDLPFSVTDDIQSAYGTTREGNPSAIQKRSFELRRINKTEGETPSPSRDSWSDRCTSIERFFKQHSTNSSSEIV